MMRVRRAITILAISASLLAHAAITAHAQQQQRQQPQQQAQPAPQLQTAPSQPQRPPPRYEVTFSLGKANTLHGLGSEAVYISTLDFGDGPIDIPFATSEQRVGEGFVWGATVDVAMGRWFSSALSFTSSNADYFINFKGTIDGTIDVLDAPLTIRAVNYAFTAHARPAGARLRPFAFFGPALISIRLSDGLEKGKRFNLPFKELGVLQRAWELGRIPVLEGGTWYHWAWRYGGGVKLRLTERLLCRIEYIEMLTEQLDFIDQSKDTLEDGLDSKVFEIPTGRFRRGAVLVGAGITF
jgi:opacity protein-like surface antigen